MSILVDAGRHALPLVPLYLFHGSFASYMLQTAFDLSLGLMLIVVTTRDLTDPTAVDPRSRSPLARFAAVLIIAVFLAIVSAIIAIPISFPAFIFGQAAGVDWGKVLTQPGFWAPIATMSVFAGIRAQGWFEAVTTPVATGQPTHAAPIIGNLEKDRARSMADNAAQVTVIATFGALSYVLLTFGRANLYALPIMYAVLLVFYDARPDLAEQIFPELWRKR